MHDLVFSVLPEKWQDAFPIGNGLLGATVYQPEGVWEWVVNHMDVVTSPYRLTDRCLPAPMSIEEVKRRAIEAHQDPGSLAHQDYNNVFGDYGATGQRKYSGFHDPLCGKLRIVPDRSEMAPTSTRQRLSMAEAIVEIEETYASGILRCESLSSRAFRCLLIRVSAEGSSSFASTLNACTDASHPTEMVVDRGTLVVSGRPSHDFSYAMGVRVISRGSLQWTNGSLGFSSSEGQEENIIAVAVSTSMDGGDPAANVQAILAEAEKAGYAEIRSRHLREWQEFWSKSAIQIPDEFLEHLWHFGLYSMSSSSGSGAHNPHGCGLYGLWYNAPARWPNCWYDDGDIEQSYWPVYTSNHLELAVPFVEGVKARLPVARRQASEWYGGSGAAYGFHLMHCIGPWYCQYLWWYYKYSGDIEFLRDTAYPIFGEVLTFFEGYLTPDKNGSFGVFPSICPEQGPVTRNDTIALACLKYLLNAAIESAEVLGVDRERARVWQDLLGGLPDFPTGRSEKYGEIILDSEWASPNLYLAHGSVLMPIYPLGQVTGGEIAENTLRYVENNTSINVHSCSWMAAAAAALGRGDEAVRILYDKLLSMTMLPTGFVAGDTDRKVEACGIMFPPCYSPPIIEAGSATVTTVNQLLIQNTPVGIRVFPALPSSWKEASFSKLLAEGAFEVSASIRDDVTDYVEIKSLAGGKCRIVNPWPEQCSIVLDDEQETEIPPGTPTVVLDTRKGATYRLQPALSRTVKAAHDIPAGMPLVHKSPYRYRVFIGRDEESHFLEKLDGFLFTPRLGSFEVPRTTRYKLDFGSPSLEKDYDEIIPEQFIPHNKYGFDFQRVGSETTLASNYVYGYGWSENTRVMEVVRQNGDCLRRDFISGQEQAEIQLLLMSGSYQALIVAGDSEEARGHTQVVLPNGYAWRSPGDPTLPGSDVSIVSFEAERDGFFPITFSSEAGQDWKICLLLINRMH